MHKNWNIGTVQGPVLIELLKNDLCIARSMLLIELAQKSLREAWNNMQEPVLARDAYKGGADN